MPLSWLHQWYLLLPVMAFLVSVVYKAVRLTDLKGYARQVVIMTVQTVVGMVALALASYLLIEVYVGWVRGG